MNQPHLLYKSAALASSILLLGGFVAYRANAFPWLSKTQPHDAPSRVEIDDVTGEHSPGTRLTADETLMMSGSKSLNRVFIPPSLPPIDSATIPFPSYKSGPVFLPPASAPTTSTSTYMSGSKSAPVFVPQQAAATPPPAVMYGSKSGVIFQPPPTSQAAGTPQSADATFMSSSKSFIMTPHPAQQAIVGPPAGKPQSNQRAR